MDKRTKKYFRLFLMRFRKNYQYFLKNYSGKNIALYRDNFINDNLKLAQLLYGDEGMKQLKDYSKKLTSV